MSNYLQVGEANLWYDEVGAGQPVILMHGNFSDSRDFAGNLATLSSRWRLLFPERRGQGHTADTTEPITMENTVTDMIAFVERLADGPAALVGYSAGATIALCVAARRPDLVSKLVLISGAFDTAAFLVRPDPEGKWPDQVVDAYSGVSPDGKDHFPIIVRKITESFDAGIPLTVGALMQVHCPTLVISADDDIVTLEHTVEMYRALPDGHLAIVPGASHLLLLEHPELCTKLVGDFLSGRQSPRLMPINRAAGQSLPEGGQ